MFATAPFPHAALFDYPNFNAYQIKILGDLVFVNVFLWDHSIFLKADHVNQQKHASPPQPKLKIFVAIFKEIVGFKCSLSWKKDFHTVACMYM